MTTRYEAPEERDPLYRELGRAIRYGFKRPAKLADKLDELLKLALVVDEADGSADRLERVLALERVLRRLIADAGQPTDTDRARDGLDQQRPQILRILFQIDDGAVGARRVGDRRTQVVRDVLGWQDPESDDHTFRGGIERTLKRGLVNELRRLDTEHRRQRKGPPPDAGLSRRPRWRRAALIVALAAVLVAVTVIVVTPDSETIGRKLGPPHGTGITHADYPRGYTFQGRPQPTFDNYLDQPESRHFRRSDERGFLTVGALEPERRPNRGFAAGSLHVLPGERLLVSAFIHNNAGDDNRSGSGPSVARNSRILVDFPNKQESPRLTVWAYLYADNALVDETDPSLHTISAWFQFISETRKPIKLDYVPGSARLLLTNRARGRSDYHFWGLNGKQELALFTGTRTIRRGYPQLAPTSGLPVGSDGSYQRDNAVGESQEKQLRWYGCTGYFGYLQFQVRVEAAGGG